MICHEIPHLSLHYPQALSLPPLQAFALFCALGLLTSLYFMICYPEFGAIFARIASFASVLAVIFTFR